jgi:hypothetical protein
MAKKNRKPLVESTILCIFAASSGEDDFLNYLGLFFF